MSGEGVERAFQQLLDEIGKLEKVHKTYTSLILGITRLVLREKRRTAGGIVSLDLWKS